MSEEESMRMWVGITEVCVTIKKPLDMDSKTAGTKSELRRGAIGLIPPRPPTLSLSYYFLTVLNQHVLVADHESHLRVVHEVLVVLIQGGALLVIHELGER